MMYGILIREFLPDRYSEQLVLNSPTHKRHLKLLTAKRSVEVGNIHVYKSNARLCVCRYVYARYSPVWQLLPRLLTKRSQFGDHAILLGVVITYTTDSYKRSLRLLALSAFNWNEQIVQF